MMEVVHCIARVNLLFIFFSFTYSQELHSTQSKMSYFQLFFPVKEPICVAIWEGLSMSIVMITSLRMINEGGNRQQ